MIPSLLPSGAVGVEAAEPEWGDDLFPAEAQLVADAVERRRREFAAGRHCARQALARLDGREPGAILVGPQREPLWPAGIVGSITHTVGYCAAAVAPATAEVRSFGIDAEPNARLADDLRDLICTPAEQAAHQRLRSIGGVDPGMLTFSAKESVYKAWFPLVRTWLDFLDVAVELAPSGRFAVELQRSAPAGALPADLSLEGRWAATDNLVFTVVVARPLVRTTRSAPAGRQPFGP